MDGSLKDFSEAKGVSDENQTPFWRREGNFYYPLGAYFRREFGEPIRKISLDAGFTCPNTDGTVGCGGCIFCDNQSFSPSRRLGLPNLTDQLNEGIRRVSARYKSGKFIAYFQPSTNTYAPPDRLRVLYGEALAHPQVVGLAIGTRPDALPDDVLDLIAELSQNAWISLEIGLQTANDATLRFLNRGHNFAAFADAVARAQARKIRLGTHLILGLPGETRADMLATTQKIAAMRLHSVKLHNLYVVKNTVLAQLYADGKVTLPTCEEYAEMVVDVLEHLPAETVIERLAGDAPREYLIAPEWSAEKVTVRNAIMTEFQRRGTWQGKLAGETFSDKESVEKE